tara:strand:+ start:39 stop:677 length:639 start_codon:yes stop_codon:yes gene_type:complete
MGKKVIYNIDDLYNAIVSAEGTGFTRTEGKPVRGSSAYGPAGLTSGTGSMIGNQLSNLGKAGFPKWSKNEVEFMQRFREQGKKMLKYGNKDWMKYVDPITKLVNGMTQEEVKSKYEYGGTGDLSEDDKKTYEIVAKKLIKSEYDRLDQDIDKFIGAWRGSTKHFVSTGGQDINYLSKFKTRLDTLDFKRQIDKDKALLMPEEAIMETLRIPK